MTGVLLQEVGEHDIPSMIEGVDFPEQLNILRGIFGYTVSPINELFISSIDGKEVRGIKSTKGVGIFIEDIGLLSFEGEYFHENIGYTTAGVTPIGGGDQKIYHGFIKHVTGKCSLYVYKDTASLHKFSYEGRDTFDSVQTLDLTFKTSIRTQSTITGEEPPISN